MPTPRNSATQLGLLHAFMLSCGTTSTAQQHTNYQADKAAIFTSFDQHLQRSAMLRF